MPKYRIPTRPEIFKEEKSFTHFPISISKLYMPIERTRTGESEETPLYDAAIALDPARASVAIVTVLVDESMQTTCTGLICA